MSFTNLNTTQNEFLVSYLRGTGRVLTSRQADSLYGIQNLRARMTELRQTGYKVRTEKNTVGTTNYAVSRRMIGQI
jgi:DNA-binding IclR family transcriptional regulator